MSAIERASGSGGLSIPLRHARNRRSVKQDQHTKNGFIAEFREAACPTSRDVCRSREQNQGDTDLTDETDSTDRSSVGSAPCATSREEVFDNSTPIAFG